ncbi:glycosyltransferase [Stanieria cyanosphaera]|nr:glycosyltransferase [Stanieria cyanosphaera]
MTTKKRITFFLDALHGGGAEKAVVKMLKGLSQRNDFDLDLVLAKLEGPYLDRVPKQVRIVNLNTGRVITALFPLINYLRQNRPWALIGNMGHVNVVATLAKKLSGIDTKLVLVEQNTLSASKSNLARANLVPPLMKWLYPSADLVAGVSDGVARDLENCLDFPTGMVKVLHNPIVDDELFANATEPLEHPWFGENQPPVFLAVGRLNPQKDFPNLLQAFAMVRQKKSARLIILGEGELRSQLEAMAIDLGISEDVALPGFVKNPYAYMSRASCFVLSSREEGLPTVLIEAMACGCTVVSTDCPSGPEEILVGGKYGYLVPIQDSVALSEGMLQALEHPLAQTTLIERANCFSIDSAVEQYLSFLNSI